MTIRTLVYLPVRSALGQIQGSLKVSLLPRTQPDAIPAPLIELSSHPDQAFSSERVQLLEGHEYLYEFVDVPYGTITTDKPEIFHPDIAGGQRGRLRTGLYTGSISVDVSVADVIVGRFAFEVRSRKLDYMTDYRWMLRDIAEGLSEALMDRFAPAEQQFLLDNCRHAPTLYQRFAFLKALLTSESFMSSVQQILARPHTSWSEDIEVRPPSQGLPARSAIIRQLTAPGPRVPYGNGTKALQTLPSRLRVHRAQETLDTPENRFIKYALTNWRAVTSLIATRLQTEGSLAATRGAREAFAVLDYLDELLSANLFREVGKLTQFPANSQVLHKRPGYREFLKAFLQFEAAAQLSWVGGEDIFGAGQRNVATLYEYWTYLRLASLIASFSSEPLDSAGLFIATTDGLGITLKRGSESRLTVNVTRLARRLSLQLYFNRSFHTNSPEGSWTIPMQPDCSLRISHNDAPWGHVWLHFDAKYRVDNVGVLFDGQNATAEEQQKLLAETQKTNGTAKTADLLKMHAYRDAIRHSAGAYVIYPGSNERDCRVYHEILPGLGAFALRPAESGIVEGEQTLRRFIDDVLTHVASQATHHERRRYWEFVTYRDTHEIPKHIPALPLLTRPPADTWVLLGYCKDKAHYQWIQETRRYNLRADGRSGSVGLGSRELAVDLALVYGPGAPYARLWAITGQPELVNRQKLINLNYPNPRGQLYFCLELGESAIDNWLPEIPSTAIAQLKQTVKPSTPAGAPVVINLLDVLRYLYSQGPNDNPFPPDQDAGHILPRL